MFPSLAARETCVAETNFAAQKQKVFLPGVKNIFCLTAFVKEVRGLADHSRRVRNEITATFLESPETFRAP